MKRRKLVRVLAASSLTVLALVGFVGFLHVPAGRPLLRAIAHAAGGACPLGYDHAPTSAEREAGRRRFAARHAGVVPALQRPALGFALHQTTRADVLAWAATHSLNCTTAKPGARPADIECRDVPGATLPDPSSGVALSSLWLTFGAGDKLVAVVDVRHDADAESITDTFHATEHALTSEAGPIANAEGDATPSALASGLLSNASVEYRFSDYYAIARAANLGASGYVLTEEFRALD
jgi:hypothetical protein